MKKLILLTVFLCLISGLLGVELVFWTAPNPLQESFWKEVVSEWNQNNPDIQIKWSTIPAAGSSEEAILTSIASGRMPDICTNIFSGFAAQLIEADILVPLNSFPDFWELMEKRKMTSIVESWKFGNDYYVLPIYSNPIMMWWRSDILKELGYDRPPRTYSEIYEISEKYSVPYEKYGTLVVMGRNWYDRWYDFITYYYAASEGSPYLDVEKARALFNNDTGKEVVTFIDTMFRNNWTAVDLGSNPFYFGVVLGGIFGPWEINQARNLFPDVFDHIAIAPPPVPDDYPEDKPIYTFADTKGLVMFATTKHKEAAWKFIKWVYSDIEKDRKWMEVTNLPPAREDLLSNPIFQEYMDENPKFAAYASHVAYAVPPALTTKTVEVQDILTTFLIEQIMYGKSTPFEALSDAATRVRRELF
ncbi:MAG TPA: extracellular solute-binding protein [Mesotoga sp.]|nr:MULTISPECIES: extracellular solute-binding protein [unclassified Mesotoga]PVD16623.1 sugar ABC transporter substrate-binding protein [Mesotoga sp. Brook.08.105.5.1]RAO96416.1 sugar ABC transporter substrate-binding protein [Mesotoga sp. Brook.08.YT.4.2.5.4.]RDI92374.1 sugar ABC transporter substrate-binding protein [Mesotoga sp. Brook.08.YT.4.2.5.2.]HNU22929.1 extracellular solute-binding protein [Mesotoga sp.]